MSIASEKRRMPLRSRRKQRKIGDPRGGSLYRALDLDYIRPNSARTAAARNSTAARGKIPRLVEAENLRGTVQTTPLRERRPQLLRAGLRQELGLQYLGIADHSRSSIQAHGLDEARLRVQIAMIRRLNETFNFPALCRYPSATFSATARRFSGRASGRALNTVVASIHSAFTLSEKDMTQRIIRAMQNPHT